MCAVQDESLPAVQGKVTQCALYRRELPLETHGFLDVRNASAGRLNFRCARHVLALEAAPAQSVDGEVRRSLIEKSARVVEPFGIVQPVDPKPGFLGDLLGFVAVGKSGRQVLEQWHRLFFEKANDESALIGGGRGLQRAISRLAGQLPSTARFEETRERTTAGAGAGGRI